MKFATNFVCVWLLLSSLTIAQSVYNTKSDVNPVVVYHADSAMNYPIGDRVAVLLTNPDKTPKSAVIVEVATQAEFITVQGGKDVFNLVNLPQISAGKWLLSDEPGEYVVFISLSSAGKPPEFIWKKAILGGQPDKPTDPQPDPVADFDSLIATTKSVVSTANDPTTANQLASGYLDIAKANVSLDKAKEQAKSHRNQTLLARTGESRNVDWNSALSAIDSEFGKLDLSTVEKYQAALKAMSEAMRETAGQQVAQTKVAKQMVAKAPPKTRRWVNTGTVCIGGTCYQTGHWVEE